MKIEGPLIAAEERTKKFFGNYVSIYDFQQLIEDGATVPLYYENRKPELQLVNPDLNDDIYNLIEQAELDPEQEARLEKELSRQYHLITRDDRLDTVAKDIVRHFTSRGFQECIRRGWMIPAAMTWPAVMPTGPGAAAGRLVLTVVGWLSANTERPAFSEHVAAAAGTVAGERA